MSAVPVIACRARAADDAFAAYKALRVAEVRDPSLRLNEHWRALVCTAYARFRAAFEVVG